MTLWANSANDKLSYKQPRQSTKGLVYGFEMIWLQFTPLTPHLLISLIIFKNDSSTDFQYYSLQYVTTSLWIRGKEE